MATKSQNKDNQILGWNENLEYHQWNLPAKKMNLSQIKFLKLTTSLQQKNVLDNTAGMQWAISECEKQQEWPVFLTNEEQGSTGKEDRGNYRFKP